jgi:hypothetical protein
MSCESREDIARQILSYFLRNPKAADSFDGIARWRLLEDIARRSVTATEDALTWLIEEGYLQQEALPGSKSLFRLNSNMREEAEQFVENPDT